MHEHAPTVALAWHSLMRVPACALGGIFGRASSGRAGLLAIR